MTDERQQRKRQGDRLYERYAKPLEIEHAGEYIAITRDGRTLLGAAPVEFMQMAKDAFGPGSFLFKVGEQAVWTLR
jgi:hypothetical protein